MPKQPPDPVAAAEALKFFAWAYEKGDKMAEELDYVPMPKKVVSKSKRCGRVKSRTPAVSRSMLPARRRNKPVRSPPRLLAQSRSLWAGTAPSTKEQMVME